MRRIVLGGLLVFATGCEKRSVPPDTAAADSAAVADSAARDSTSRDSTARDSTARDSTPPIIGRDSAFGPLLAVDSLGRKVDLPSRRP